MKLNLLHLRCVTTERVTRQRYENVSGRDNDRQSETERETDKQRTACWPIPPAQCSGPLNLFSCAAPQTQA